MSIDDRYRQACITSCLVPKLLASIIFLTLCTHYEKPQQISALTETDYRFNQIHLLLLEILKI